MLIKKLEEAEQIVKSNKDLRWSGWDIISREITTNGFSHKSGSFINNRWGIDRRYPITDNGWYLPNNLGVKKW